MRPNTWGSLRWIAAVLLLSGCYRPFMNPQPGYGYGGAYQGGMSQGGYGGYQGNQTLTPGQYYAPAPSGTPTYQQGTPNGLQPIVDPNNSGGGTGGGGGNGTGGGDAPIYNPQGTESPVRPAPMYPETPSLDDPGSGLQEPATDPNLRENNSGTGDPSALLEPAPLGNWATESDVEAAEPLIEPVNSEEVEPAMEVPLRPTP